MTQDIFLEIKKQSRAARTVSLVLSVLNSQIKNAALCAMAQAIEESTDEILAANTRDLALHRDLSPAMTRRLTMSRESIGRMADGLRTVAALADPVGAIERMTKRPNGLLIGRMRIPIGVIGVIFESRPNVIVDIAGIMLKSGNACVLRGGKEAVHTNSILARIMRETAGENGVPPDYLQFIEHTDHEVVRLLCENDEDIDLMIPRGGSALMEAVHRHARMPVLAHNKGICHVYIEKSADRERAIRIAVNAKVSNPSACNSAETILIDEAAAPAILPRLIAELQKQGVEVRGCEKTRAIVSGITAATAGDWTTEYLDFIISIKVVRDINEALSHIKQYATGVSEAIITEDYARAWQFLRTVASAAVYVNASTRFTDGAEFGLGAEVGISTARTYDRGPMGVEELTVTKYVIFGEGQIRQ